MRIRTKSATQFHIVHIAGALTIASYGSRCCTHANPRDVSVVSKFLIVRGIFVVPSNSRFVYLMRSITIPGSCVNWSLPITVMISGGLTFNFLPATA